MNTNDLNTALYEKMAAEQDNYRDWLKSQPPEEILHHTYEYTVREDIVMAMEQLELTAAQAQALLDSPTPLADVYRYFEKLETGYMDGSGTALRTGPMMLARPRRSCGKPPFILTPLPMRKSMESWSSTGPPTTPIFNARRPLKRRCGNTSTGCISVTMPPRA